MPRVSDEQALACCEMPSLVVASKQDFARDLVDARDTRNQALKERDEARCALSAACARLADVLNLTLPSNYDPVDAIAADIGRLLDVERLWIEACRIARACCPVRDGESHVRDGIPRLSDLLADARRERDEARATLAELRAHGIDIDNGVWTGRVRLSDGSSPMTDEIEEAFVELAALKTQAAYLREVLHGISMMSEEAVLEEPDRAQRIAREALYATKPKETL